MALRERDIIVSKQPTSPATEEAARKKAEFDSSMVMVRHHVRFADREAGEYFFREMMKQCRTLSMRYGLKIS